MDASVSWPHQPGTSRSSPVLRARAAIPGSAAESVRLVVGARCPALSPRSGVLQVRGALPGGQLSWRLESRPWGAPGDVVREGGEAGLRRLTIKARCVVGRLTPLVVRVALDVWPESSGSGAKAGAQLRFKLAQSSAATFLPERRGLGHTCVTASSNVGPAFEGVSVDVNHTAGAGTRKSVWLHSALQVRLPAADAARADAGRSPACWPVSVEGGALRMDLLGRRRRGATAVSTTSPSLATLPCIPGIRLKKLGVAYLPSRVDATRWIVPILPYYASSRSTLAVVNSGCTTVGLGATAPALHMPVARERFKVSSAFGPRVHPVHGVRGHHNGIDFADHCGAPIYATEGGMVTHSGPAGGFGNLVEVSHGRGLTSLYGHLHTCLVPQGAMVRRGQLVGLMGTTGNSTGVHLHFEVRDAANRPIDPSRILR